MGQNGVSVISVRETLIVTMPSDPGDSLISNLQNEVLNALERTRARGVVLDISVVETLDSYFARMVQETASMVAVSGGVTVVCGMRPSVAITATELGIDMTGIRTSLNVERALDQIEASVMRGS